MGDFCFYCYFLVRYAVFHAIKTRNRVMNQWINKKCYTTVCVVLLIIFCTWRLNVSKGFFLNYIASAIVYPVLVMQHYIAQPLKKFFTKKKLYYDVCNSLNRIQKERDLLLAAHVMLRSTQIMHNKVQELIQFRKRYNVSYAYMAQIILKNISPEAHFWLIDAGSVHGIEQDMVAVCNNCLVGRVTHVYQRYSKVTLITDHTCRVAIYTTKNGTQGIYKGCNNADRGMIEHVSHLACMTEGEMVFSSGQGLIFPAGFALGTINRYVQGPLFYEIETKPLIDVRKIEYCYLIKK
jgi:rod shape-determining protein MreC